MTIRTDDLEKYSDLVALLDGWVAAADNVGVKLTSVRVQVGTSSVDFSLTEEPPNESYWEIA